MTQAEKERLAELLRDIDEEEEESAGGADSEVGQQEALTDNTCCGMSVFSNVQRSVWRDDLSPLHRVVQRPYRNRNFSLK